jgi:hypothetical protein
MLKNVLKAKGTSKAKDDTKKPKKKKEAQTEVPVSEQEETKSNKDDVDTSSLGGTASEQK